MHQAFTCNYHQYRAYCRTEFLSEVTDPTWCIWCISVQSQSFASGRRSSFVALLQQLSGLLRMQPKPHPLRGAHVIHAQDSKVVLAYGPQRGAGLCDWALAHALHSNALEAATDNTQVTAGP